MPPQVSESHVCQARELAVITALLPAQKCVFGHSLPDHPAVFPDDQATKPGLEL
jgi:hypothetical protein